MKYELPCEIVRDLLPSYVDDLTSDESTEAVRAHLQNCNECRRAHEAMKLYSDKQVTVHSDEKRSFQRMRRKLTKRTAAIVVVTILLCLVACGSLLWLHSGYDLAPEEYSILVNTITKDQVNILEDDAGKPYATYGKFDDGTGYEEFIIEAEDYDALMANGSIQQIIITSEKSIDAWMLGGGETEHSLSLSVSTNHASLFKSNKKTRETALWLGATIDTIYDAGSRGDHDVVWQRK